MHQVSVRTLTLLVILLMAVVSHGYLSTARAEQVKVYWLAGTCAPAGTTCIR